MIDKALIEALKKGQTDGLKAFYTEHKNAFYGFAKKYNLDESVVKDIYQDAIIALRDNALNGNLDTLKSELKTYLFSIGKYMIFKEVKKRNKLYSITDETDFEHFNKDNTLSVEIVGELTYEQEKLRTAFAGLGQKCKDVLTLFYYRGFTLEEIKDHLKYNNTDVVKSQKSRCLKSLKTMITHPRND